jgi:hypothetical protein
MSAGVLHKSGKVIPAKIIGFLIPNNHGRNNNICYLQYELKGTELHLIFGDLQGDGFK